MRKLIVVLVLLSSGVAVAAKIYVQRERVQLSAARATSFHNVIVGEFPACTNWRHGHFQKECASLGVKVGEPLGNGSCAVGNLVTVLYPACRYTPANLDAVPDGFALETE
jgi:hypothetical protein